MAITSKQVLAVSGLAKLEITESEIETLTPQLSKVIDYVSELSQVDTKNIKEVSQTTGLTNITRDDEIDVTRCLSEDEALSGTDNIHNGYIVVKKILDK